MYTWIKAFKEGRLSANEAVHTPKNALSLNDELIGLRKRVKEQDKEIRRLKDENEFLEEASAFFAASRRKFLFIVKYSMSPDRHSINS